MNFWVVFFWDIHKKVGVKKKREERLLTEILKSEPFAYSVVRKHPMVIVQVSDRHPSEDALKPLSLSLSLL